MVDIPLRWVAIYGAHSTSTASAVYTVVASSPSKMSKDPESQHILSNSSSEIPAGSANANNENNNNDNNK